MDLQKIVKDIRGIIQHKDEPVNQLQLFDSEAAEIKKLLRQEGCPICRIGDDAFEKKWFWFFHESYSERTGAAAYIDNYGFCEKHTIEVLKMGPKWQKSIIYSLIIKYKLPKLEQLGNVLNRITLSQNRIDIDPNRKELNGAIKQVLPAGGCLFCNSVEQTERYYLKILLKSLNEPMMLELFKASHGLCLKHYFIALEYTDPEYSEGLMEVTKHILPKIRELKQSFDEFFRKSDYRFANEPKGDEQNAWLNAIRLFLGRTEDITIKEWEDTE
ncbi:MAG: DUF6062 family protein [Methanotrichaceae archaeon]